MRIIYVILLLLGIVLLNACRKDFDTVKSKGELRFSKDTVFLDTVFSTISSSTRSFKVYNKSNSAITIPTISLGRGESSFYRLNVDGIPGKSFTDIDILANDSIYIFVEATIDVDAVSNPLYLDSIVFDAADNLQDVDLVTLVQDAHFLFPQRDSQGINETIVLGQDQAGNDITVDGFLLDDTTTWTNDKPYVIYGYVGVPTTKRLTIEAGTKVHFHNNSGLLVQSGASLKVNGELGNKVVFESDRLEPNFSNVAGQWGTIWLREGSSNNEIHYAEIKNSTIGLLVDSNDGTNTTLTLSNTEIYNNSSFGILGRQTSIEAENIVISNAGQSVLACTLGGLYNFKHSTFANYWNKTPRNAQAVAVSNYITTLDENNNEIIVASDLIEANFSNCIIDGNQNIEFALAKVEEVAFNYKLTSSLLKFDTNDAAILTNPLYDFTDSNFYENIVLNGVTDFKNIAINELIIGQDSDAVGNGEPNTAFLVPFDILGVSRTNSPDIGAYQHIVFEE